MKSLSSSKEEHFLGVVFLIALFLPHTSTPLLLVNPLLCIVLSAYFAKIKKYRKDAVKYMLIGSIAISLLLNFVLGAASSKSVLATCNLLLMLSFFPFVSDVRIRNVYIYIALTYIVVSQVTMFIHIPAVSDFYEIVYPISEESMGYYQYVLDSVTSDSISGFRLAGLFRNPNQCSKYVTLITAVFLLDSNTSLKKSLPFLGCAAMSVLMTGSRTGLVVFMGIVFISLLLNDTVSKATKSRSLFILFALFIIMLINASDFRGLKVGEGMNDSANAKFGAISDYLSQNVETMGLLFGHLDQYLFVASNSKIHSSIDCEYGYMIFNYGIVGFIFYILFFCTLFKKFSKYECLIFVPMLWIISASMLMSFRSLFLYMILLSKYYIRSKKKKYGYMQ